MAADGGPLTGGPGLSLCLLLAARSSAGPSKPSRPLKAEKERERGKSTHAAEMITFKHCAPSAISDLSHICKDQTEFYSELCLVLICSLHKPFQALSTRDSQTIQSDLSRR